MQVHLHHKGPVGIVRPRQHGVDVEGGQLLDDSLDDVFATVTRTARWR
jgi:hypothetical protein